MNLHGLPYVLKHSIHHFGNLLKLTLFLECKAIDYKKYSQSGSCSCQHDQTVEIFNKGLESKSSRSFISVHKSISKMMTENIKSHLQLKP